MMFQITKPFAVVKLFPSEEGLRIIYHPVINGESDQTGTAFCDLRVSTSCVGDLWATAKTLLQSTEVLDYNLSVSANGEHRLPRIKLFRDRSGSCWFQIIDVPQARRIRKLELGIRDLQCFDLACQTTISMSIAAGITQAQAPQSQPRAGHYPAAYRAHAV